MNRRTLTSIMGLGVTVTLMGGSGLFAAFTDQAADGTDRATSKAQPRAADIQIAQPADYPSGNLDACGTFTEDLTTGLFTVDSQVPGSTQSTFPRDLCIRNVGASPVSLATSVVDLVDTDIACTGDEAGSGDTTCGTEQLGELSHMYYLYTGHSLGCGSTGASGGHNYLRAAQTTPVGITTLQPGETSCIRIELKYLPAFFFSTAQIQQAQTDRMTFRLVFDATQA